MHEVRKILPAILAPHMETLPIPLPEILRPLWPVLVGPAISRQTQPRYFCGGTLTILVQCPGWKVPLEALAEEIRGALNTFFARPIVRRLSFELSPAFSQSGTSEKEKPAIDRREFCSEEQEEGWGAELAPILSGLEPEIRKLLRRSMAKYFSRSRGRPPRWP